MCIITLCNVNLFSMGKESSELTCDALFFGLEDI